MNKKHTSEDQAAIRSDWRSVEALCEIVNQGARNKTISSHAVRHYVRQAESNGLSPYIRRLGRKILISESGFYEWLNGLSREAA